MRKIELPNCPQWLLDADTYNEDVNYDIYGIVQWNSGNFRGGNFRGGNFRGGNFMGGDFIGGDFRGGDFIGGDFIGGNFIGGNFRGGNFMSGDFIGGNFIGGNFRGGNFMGGDFIGGNFRGGTMHSHCKWLVGLTADGLVKIGCKVNSFDDWDKWFEGKEEFSTKRGTKDFAKIQAMYLSLKAYTQFLNDFNNK